MLEIPPHHTFLIFLIQNYQPVPSHPPPFCPPAAVDECFLNFMYISLTWESLLESDFESVRTPRDCISYNLIVNHSEESARAELFLLLLKLQEFSSLSSSALAFFPFFLYYFQHLIFFMFFVFFTQSISIFLSPLSHLLKYHPLKKKKKNPNLTLYSP